MLINPPPDVRLLVDKTAATVAKMGRQFEERLQADSRTNPKLGFMSANDPYHPYYRQKLSEFQEMGAVVAEAFLEDIRQRQAAMEREQRESGEAAKEDGMPKKPTVPEPPALDFYYPRVPTAALDLDVIKLVAMHAAQHGKPFLVALAQREARNSQFDFLQPHHSHHAMLNHLIDQYSRVLRPSISLQQRLRLSKSDLMCSIEPRVEWHRYLRDCQARKESQEKTQQAALSAIDWHDFWVADRLDFATSDTFAVAMDPQVYQAMSTVEREALWRPKDVLLAEDDAMEIDDDEPQEVMVKAKFDPPQKCPNCGQVLPSSQMAEHLRIELLDPRWAEQRKAYQAKHAETNLLRQGSEIERNLARMRK